MIQEKLEEAKRLYKTANSDQKYVLESLFPELRESEDERIRKNIISWLKNIEGQTIPINDYNSAIDWLEKQGEQKPFDYENVNILQRDFAPKSAMEAINEEKVDNANKVIVKPIFKIGDFIVDNCGYVWKIVGIINQFYILEGVEGDESRPTIEFVNQTFHRWTIKDAKDGDILMTTEDERPFIFKDLSDKSHPEYPVAYCGIDVTDRFMISSSGNFWWTNEEVCPAMNEESDISFAKMKLFNKMKEEGYEWDAEKKELKKIEQKATDKTEPKFKVGDWIVFNGLTLYIKAIVKGYYVTISKGGIPNSYDWNIDRAARLWTIADAKDGDVLYTKWDYTRHSIFIFDKIDNWKFDEPNGDRAVATGHCCLSILSDGISSDGMEFGIQGPDCIDVNTVKPATKEECDLLFQKIKEAGYVWDVEKKELRKIEQKPTDNEMKELLRTEYEKGRSDAIGEFQKYAWSDKDEEILLKIMFAFKTGVFPSSNECDSFIEFLKSIKDKFSQNIIDVKNDENDTVVCDCVEN